MKIKPKVVSIFIIFITIFNIFINSVGTKLSSSSNTTSFNTVAITNSIGEQRSIYLTFDDGPSTIVTSRILDTLKEERVKATFFVVGYKINGREQILRRIYREGHSIGLHTYTHKYKNIYANNEAFIGEMDRTAAEIRRVIGVDSKIIRFPSGSKKHLNYDLLNKLHSRDYKIFDWNLSLSDGIDYNTPTNKLIKEATGKCINPNKIFLLLHCDQPNKNTYEALGKIIKYYKNAGYEFKAITTSTPEYYFRISK